MVVPPGARRTQWLPITTAASRHNVPRTRHAHTVAGVRLRERECDPHRAVGRERALTCRRMHPYHGWPFLTSPQHPTLSAVGAVLIHGSISLFVVLPIVLRSSRRVLCAALAFLGGSALDLDHVVAAGSFRPQALESLGHRPDTHSLLLAVALTLLALAITRSKPPRLGGVRRHRLPSAVRRSRWRRVLAVPARAPRLDPLAGLPGRARGPVWDQRGRGANRTVTATRRSSRSMIAGRRS